MNFWQIILLLSAGQGILLSVALISSVYNRRWQNVFLGLFLVTVSLELLNIWRIKTGLEGSFPFWNFQSYLIIPPAIYLFSKVVTRPMFKVRKVHLILFIPAILEMATAFSYHFMLYSRIPFRLNDQWWWVWPTQIIPVPLIVITLFVFAADILNLKNHIKRSGIGLPDTHLRKVTVFFFTLCAFTLLWILEAFLNLPVLNITLIILCCLLYVISYGAIITPDFFQLPAYLTKMTTRPGHMIADSVDEIRKIDEAFTTEQLYLQPGLTIKDAAAQLNMPARQLSNLINAHHNLDFRNYLNDLRVKEVMRKVEAGESEQKTLLAIALESGFSSKSTFNKAFKDQTGKTPSMYFKQ